jgi:hypothetical protein
VLEATGTSLTRTVVKGKRLEGEEEEEGEGEGEGGRADDSDEELFRSGKKKEEPLEGEKGEVGEGAGVAVNEELFGDDVEEDLEEEP